MKRLSILLLVCLTLFALASCGDERSHAATAVEYIEALNRQELDRLSAYVCDERVDEVTAALMTVSDAEQGAFSFDNVSCEARGNDVLCRYTLRQDVGAAGTREVREVTFAFNADGEICGFAE